MWLFMRRRRGGFDMLVSGSGHPVFVYIEVLGFLLSDLLVILIPLFYLKRIRTSGGATGLL